MLPLLKRHEVQVLLGAGHTHAEVAKLSGVSERTVDRIAVERRVEHLDDDSERNTRRIGGGKATAPAPSRSRGSTPSGTTGACRTRACAWSSSRPRADSSGEWADGARLQPAEGDELHSGQVEQVPGMLNLDADDTTGRV